jgi:hypothetical protein
VDIAEPLVRKTFDMPMVASRHTSSPAGQAHARPIYRPNRRQNKSLATSFKHYCFSVVGQGS